MAVKYLLFGLILAATIVNVGCTQNRLRGTTIHQANTMSEIHTQQVLNNLAMFVDEPNSLPYLLIPNGSSASVTDTARGDSNLTFPTTTLNLGGSRQVNGNFTLTPISDPHKLALMRCAYQTAIWNCGCGAVSTECPSCEERFAAFYKGSNVRGGDNQRCLDEKSYCWFNCGCKKDVPKHFPRQYVGHHQGTYVWVEPEGRGELTTLSLAILDFALYDPPQPQTRKVVRTVSKNADGDVTGVTEQTTFDEPIEGQFRSSTLSPSAYPSNLLPAIQQLQRVPN